MFSITVKIAKMMLIFSEISTYLGSHEAAKSALSHGME